MTRFDVILFTFILNMADADGKPLARGDGAGQDPTVAQRLDEMLLEVRSQRDQLTRLTRAYAADADQLARFHTLAEAWNVRKIQAHVRDVLAAAPVLTDPFPHLIIHPLLPREAFDLLLAAIPPDDFFEGDDPRKRDVRKLESSTLPLLSMAIWRSLARDVVSPVLAPALAERFRPFAREFLSVSVGEEFVDEALALPLRPDGYRLMQRRPAFTLPPHLDPRDKFINSILYLARAGDPEAYGTQLFRVHQENFVASRANTYYPEDEGIRCELVKTVPYRGNLCLTFLNLGGAHGAVIPADAQPADLRRLAFQFYMRAGRNELEALIDRLPAERQVSWKLRETRSEVRQGAGALGSRDVKAG